MSNRGFYETGLNLSLEREVANEVADAWRCKSVKMPKYYKCDSALVRGRLVKAFVEIKCRDVLPETYKTIILSVDKFTFLVEQDKATRLPCFLVVRFVDRSIRYVRLAHLEDFSVEIGGRNDRQDSDDTEAVVHIPVDKMSVLKKPAP